MKTLLRPSVVIPIVLSVAIIAALLVFADLKTIIALITRFPLGNLLRFFLLMVVYEIVRGAQWHLLLNALRVRAPLRAQIFAFVMSEFSRNLPVGSFFQNYLLEQSTGADFSRTSAATTLILASEIGLCFLGVMVLGLGAWTPWLRPLIIAVIVALVLLVWAYTRLRHSSRAPRWITEHRLLRKAAEGVGRFREGAADLLHPRTLLVQGLLGAAYLVIAGAGLYVVATGLDPHDSAITFPRMLAVYFFTLASAVILPVPEAGGVGAFLALGVSRNVAVGAMLLNRVLSVISALITAAIVTAILPGELRAALQARREKSRAPASAAGTPARSTGEQG